MSEPSEKKPSLWQVIYSVLGAMFGVQSSKAHERDFAKGSPVAYIIVGIVITVLFVLTLVGVVRCVMAGVGKA